MAKESMIYLGSLLSSDGSIESEVSRRIGIAMEEFKNLKQVWNHSHISRYEKLNIFTSCIVSKLTYALHTAWLNSNIRRRLNGFQCKCLRQILNILPSFLSRISNHDILLMAGVSSISNLILEQPLLYFGKLARDDQSVPRKFIFQQNSLHLTKFAGMRRRERPRL